MNNKDRRQFHGTLLQGTPRRAFTLIELLIVIALTALLLTLLIVPLISALRYTQQAQIVTAAQDAARITRERITRELGSAVFVFDGTSHPFQLTSGTAIAPGDDAYTNFLDLQILTKMATLSLPMPTAPSSTLSCRSSTTAARRLIRPHKSRLLTHSPKTARRSSAIHRLFSRWPPAQMPFAISSA